MPYSRPPAYSGYDQGYGGYDQGMGGYDQGGYDQAYADPSGYGGYGGVAPVAAAAASPSGMTMVPMMLPTGQVSDHIALMMSMRPSLSAHGIFLSHSVWTPQV